MKKLLLRLMLVTFFVSTFLNAQVGIQPFFSGGGRGASGTMKKLMTAVLLLIATAFCVCAQSTAGGIIDGPLASAVGSASVGPNYTAYYTITTDHTQAGTADSTNYPVLVSVSRTGFKQRASGGYLTNVNAYDHVYTTTLPTLSGGRYVCTSLMDWDSVTYTNSTGYVEDFVLLSTLHHSTNDTFYMCVGNSAITTFQGNTNTTWTAFSAVRHMNESAAPYADSTGNGHASVSGTYPSQTTGLFGFAQSFVGASSQYILAGTPFGSGLNNSLTVSMWVNSSNTATTQAIYDNRPSDGQGEVLYWATSTGFAQFYCNPTSGSGQISSTVNIADGAWHLVTGVMNSNVCTLYVDAVNLGSVSNAKAPLSSGDRIGVDYLNTSSTYATALIQENHESTTAFTSSWITADFNSQEPGSTFLTVTP